MWISGESLITIVLRTAIIYAAVLGGIRLLGKRDVGQMAPFDLVLLLLIANAVQNAMTGPDTSVTGGLVAAAVLLVLNKIVGVVAYRFKGARNVVDGTPTLLIHNGKILRNNLAKEEVTQEELEQALREHGVAKADEVHTAMLEVDGSVSVLKFDDVKKTSHATRRIKIFRKHS